MRSVDVLLVLVAALSSDAFAREMAVNEAKSEALYQSGVMMERIMAKKEVS